MLVTSMLRTRDRDNSVTSKQLPVLIPARGGHRGDALLFVDRKPTDCLLLGDDALAIFLNDKNDAHFERRYGKVLRSYEAGIKAAMALIQAIESKDNAKLKDYAAWQAVAEVESEIELANKIGKHLPFVPATVKRLREQTYREEYARLQKHISSSSPLVAIAELLMQLNRWVSKAKLVIYMGRVRQQPLPGLYCPDVSTGLAAMVFSRLPNPAGLGVCRRPSCGKTFLRIRRGQQYCSLRCGNADRKARERARRRA